MESYILIANRKIVTHISEFDRYIKWKSLVLNFKHQILQRFHTKIGNVRTQISNLNFKGILDNLDNVIIAKYINKIMK